MENFFSQLFTELNSEDSIAILVFLGIAFILGLLIGLLLRGGGKKAKKALEEREQELVVLKADLEGTKEQLELKEADLRKANIQVEETQIKFRKLEEEKSAIQGELYAANDQLDKYHTRLESDAALIEDLNNQILGLKAKQNQLKEAINEAETVRPESRQSEVSEKTKEQLQQLENKIKELEKEKEHLDQLEEKVVQLQAENKDLKSNQIRLESMEIEGVEKLQEKLTLLEKENQTLQVINNKLLKLEQESGSLKAIAAKLQKLENEHASFRNLEGQMVDLSAIRQQVEQLSFENAHLQQALEELQRNEHRHPPLSASEPANSPAGVIDETEEEQALQKARSDRNEIERLISTKIKVATVEDRDDLTKIEGIGPFIEEKLNAIGIFTYEQISQFDDDLINQVTTAIGYFPGRIERDDWVGQAKKLLLFKEEKEEPVAVTVLKDPSDLKIVEGIGPKIEQLLKMAGLNNWSDLANAEVEHLKIILSEAGDRYRMHTPDTWPEQARLAVDGKWEQLEEYQDYLKGGRDLSKS